MKKKIIILVLLCIIVSSCNKPNGSNNIPEKQGMRLVWNDEFSGKKLNENNWIPVLGEGAPPGWGNKEAQYYTDRNENVRVSDGNLVITARKEKYKENLQSEYTSARIRTASLFATKYGYIEARIKLPATTGMWPAFWMMPEWTTPYGGWPTSGEIDIMEARGREPGYVTSALHYGGSSYGGLQSTYQHAMYYFKNSTIEQYHTYALRWEEARMEWFVDDVSFFVMEPESKKDGGWWTPTSDKPLAPFDTEFHFIFNMAVGGEFDGGRLPPEDFIAASMYVDYIRVYEFL